MMRTSQAYIFCLDEHRNFSEEVRKRFSDTAKYKIFSSVTHIDFLRNLNDENERHNCKVAILTIYDGKEQGLLIENLTKEIKKNDPGTGLILVFPAEKSDEIKKSVIFNIDSYIPRNANTILRLHNAVKKLISEHNLEIYRRRRNMSVYILLAFLLLSGVLFLVARLKLPVYF